MGRKIPGRKHRGVKDPDKQRAERFEKIKDKVNAPPLDPDDQQISYNLSRLIDLKNKVKSGFYNKKTHKKKNEEGEEENVKKLKKFKGKPEKMIPKFEQKPGETDRQFKHRMNKICSEVIKEAAFEDKYNVDIKRNEEGQVEGVVKRPKDELTLIIKKARKEQKTKNQKGKKRKKDSEEKEKPKLTKSQKWALKKAEKKKKKTHERDEDYSFEPKKDNVKFGEIVHAPPSLIAPKKVEKIQGAARPGQKQLLLKAMLNAVQINKVAPLARKEVENKKTAVSKTSKAINKKGKRKDLPNAMRRQLDKQQKEIIAAYKNLKLKRYSD